MKHYYYYYSIGFSNKDEYGILGQGILNNIRIFIGYVFNESFDTRRTISLLIL